MSLQCVDRSFPPRGALLAGARAQVLGDLVSFYRTPEWSKRADNHIGDFRTDGFWIVLTKHRDRTRLISFRPDRIRQVCGWIENIDLRFKFDLIRSRP